MVGFTEIVFVAFVAQLSVLPGEKVQFIIAGLSTRFSPALVVAAAGSAFALWTTIEILAGAALQSVLPGTVLDAITAGLFLLFAVLLVRSAPPADRDATDGDTTTGDRRDGDAADGNLTDGGLPTVTEGVSIAGREVALPGRLSGFLPIFGLMAVGEVGDKTQLVTIGLAAQYGATPAIWVGEMAAIVPVSALNALLFYRLSHRFDRRKAHFAGAALFAFFGLDTVLALTVDVSVWETIVGTLTESLLAVA